MYPLAVRLHGVLQGKLVFILEGDQTSQRDVDAGGAVTGSPDAGAAVLQGLSHSRWPCSDRLPVQAEQVASCSL